MMRAIAGLSLFAALLPAVGCDSSGPRRWPVGGAVTWKGEPLAEGNIAFINEKEGAPEAAPIKDGKYQLLVQEGKYRVQITATRPGKVNPINKWVTYDQYLPKKYNAQTTLAATITNGDNRFDFALEGK